MSVDRGLILAIEPEGEASGAAWFRIRQGNGTQRDRPLTVVTRRY